MTERELTKSLMDILFQVMEDAPMSEILSRSEMLAHSILQMDVPDAPSEKTTQDKKTEFTAPRYNSREVAVEQDGIINYYSSISAYAKIIGCDRKYLSRRLNQYGSVTIDGIRVYFRENPRHHDEDPSCIDATNL